MLLRIDRSLAGWAFLGICLATVAPGIRANGAQPTWGGLFIIETDSRDEALHVASMHPAATLGEEGG